MLQRLCQRNVEQRHGRTLECSEYEEAVIENRKRILRHRDKYKRRQSLPRTFVGAIVEHPFGKIKRNWCAYYTLLKSKEKRSGEMGIILTEYNLRRVVSILGAKRGVKALKVFQNGCLGLLPWSRGGEACCGTQGAMWARGLLSSRSGRSFERSFSQPALLDHLEPIRKDI